MTRKTKYGDCRYCDSRIIWRSLPTNRPPPYITHGFCSRDCETGEAEYQESLTLKVQG